jgi:hypothetical protein
MGIFALVYCTLVFGGVGGVGMVLFEWVVLMVVVWWYHGDGRGGCVVVVVVD